MNKFKYLMFGGDKIIWKLQNDSGNWIELSNSDSIEDAYSKGLPGLNYNRNQFIYAIDASFKFQTNLITNKMRRIKREVIKKIKKNVVWKLQSDSRKWIELSNSDIIEHAFSNQLPGLIYTRGQYKYMIDPSFSFQINLSTGKRRNLQRSKSSSTTISSHHKPVVMPAQHGILMNSDPSTNIPIGGLGIVINNKSHLGDFWVLKIIELHYSDGSVYKLSSNSHQAYKPLIKLSKKLTQKYKHAPNIGEPRSDGAGPHISLLGDYNCQTNIHQQILFHFDSPILDEYSGYITLAVSNKLKRKIDNVPIKLTGKFGKLHVTIGRLK